MWFMESFLGAAAGLETYSENPSARKCCTRTSMRADSSAFPWRHDMVETKGHVGMA